MGRWSAGAQERLQGAAIELFSQRGYERTTVADIAERAGLTERTFYNHFVDKREVLFPGQDRFIAEVVEAVGAAPADRSPLDAVVAALTVGTEWFDQRREAAQLRRRIIDTRAELRERELAKMAALETAITGALRARASSDTSAALTAAAAMAAYQLGADNWLADPRGRTLGHHLRSIFEELRRTAEDW